MEWNADFPKGEDIISKAVKSANFLVGRLYLLDDNNSKNEMVGGLKIV
jgi:hypothetical protein